MKIVRTDPFTGKINCRDLDVTQEQIDRWRNGELIQNAMPQLNADDREFVKTGIVWKDTFGEQE